MPWLLMLHISALLFWFGTLLYLPTLLNGFARQDQVLEGGEVDNRLPVMPRQLFTWFATPAALLAIVSGTAVFLLHNIVAVWLIAKLTLVSGLVICHCLLGLLINAAHKGPVRRLSLCCWLLGAATAALVAGILWLVLAKPF